MINYITQILLIVSFITFIFIFGYHQYFYSFFSLSYAHIDRSKGEPILHDPNLSVEVVTAGLKFPTTMAFLGPNDILVLEKNNGHVQRVVNGKIMPKPVLDVNVANKQERGMLGIAIAKEGENKAEGSSDIPYVFLYYTETKTEGSDVCPTPSKCLPGNDPLGNRLYRYEFLNNNLVNPKLLLDLPARPIPSHNGGKIIIGPDNNVYLVVGDVGHRSITQNFANNPYSNGTGVIYQVTQEGEPVKDIFGSKHPVNKYYAYRIRNSFGMDFDPITGILWDTENGPSFGDEINLVEPGFNSGWRKMQGIWETNGTEERGKLILNETSLAEKVAINPKFLQDWGGKGKYSSPEFTWLNTSGPTAIKFLNSGKLGKQYENDILVGDYHGGNIYRFKLNEERTELMLNAPLADKMKIKQTSLRT